MAFTVRGTTLGIPSKDLNKDKNILHLLKCKELKYTEDLC